MFGSSELGLWKDGETSREVAKLIIAVLTPIANKAKSEMPEQVNYYFANKAWNERALTVYYVLGKSITVCREFKVDVHIDMEQRCI